MGFYKSDEEEQESVAEMSDAEFERYSKRRESKPQSKTEPKQEGKHSVTVHSDYTSSERKVLPNYSTDDVLPSAEKEERITSSPSTKSSKLIKATKPAKKGKPAKPVKPAKESSGYEARKYDRDLENYKPVEESQEPYTPKGVSSKDETLDSESEVKAKGSKATKQNSTKTGFVSPTDFLVQKGVEHLTPFLKKLSKFSDALNGSTYGLYKSIGKAVKK